jgi:hypothetical protein
MTVKEAHKIGQSMIGQFVQSNLLKELTANGKTKLRDPMKVTAYEIVEMFQQSEIMLVIDGESVLLDYVIGYK